jgi:hypothetical protein
MINARLKKQHPNPVDSTSHGSLKLSACASGEVGKRIASTGIGGTVQTSAMMFPNEAIVSCRLRRKSYELPAVARRPTRTARGSWRPSSEPLQDVVRVELQGCADVDEFDHVQLPLAALILADERLVGTDLHGQLILRQSGGFARGLQKQAKLFLSSRVNGFLHARSAYTGWAGSLFQLISQNSYFLFQRITLVSSVTLLDGATGTIDSDSREAPDTEQNAVDDLFQDSLQD